MVVIKMTHFKHIPDTCEDCTYYSCRPHPYKGWSDGCELCCHCMDDDQEDDWIYDGDSRPKNCPLMEIPTASELLKDYKRLKEEAPTKEEAALLKKWRDGRGVSMEEFTKALNILRGEDGK